MVDRRRIARRLGDPAARHQRHKRVAALLALVLVAGLALVLAGGDGDGGGDGGDREGDDTVSAGGVTDPTVAACLASNVEIATAQRALLEDNENPGAVEGFLGDAFVDLARQRAEAIAGSAPPEAVGEVLAEQQAVVDAIEADPSSAAGTANPFEAVNQRWRDLGLPDCAIDSTTVRSDG